jgi:hypothetical protein
MNASNLFLNSASNLMAVEVHQNATNSSDIVFGMALYAEYYFPNNPPKFQTPLVDLTVKPGEMAWFTADVTGLAPLTYQWRFNGQRIAGQSGSTLAIFDTQAAQLGEYTVVVTNMVGAITSRVARLSFSTPPQIVEQPRSQQVLPGGTLVLSVTATGGSLAYQWWQNAQTLAWATNALLTMSNVPPSVAGLYQVVVTNAQGAITSQPAVVQIIGPRLLVPQLSAGALQLRFAAEPGSVYSIDASEDLILWTPLQTMTNLTGTIEFMDQEASWRTNRFYKLRLVP